MTADDAWQQVAHECPLRILAELHRSGEYAHGRTARFPGKVLCCHRDAPRPDGWVPTPAQGRAWQPAAPAPVPPPLGVEPASSAG